MHNVTVSAAAWTCFHCKGQLCFHSCCHVSTSIIIALQTPNLRFGFNSYFHVVWLTASHIQCFNHCSLNLESISFSALIKVTVTRKSEYSVHSFFFPNTNPVLNQHSVRTHCTVPHYFQSVFRGCLYCTLNVATNISGKATTCLNTVLARGTTSPTGPF